MLISRRYGLGQRSQSCYVFDDLSGQAGGVVVAVLSAKYSLLYDPTLEDPLLISIRP